MSITHDEFEFGNTNELIDEILVARFKDVDQTLKDDIKDAFVELMAKCGLFGLNTKGEPTRAGWIDTFHDQLCFSFSIRAGEIRNILLKPGQVVDLYLDGSKIETVKVIANDDETSKMRFKLDVSDDCAVIGSRAAMSAMLPGSEHLKLDENGLIVSNLLTEGESKNEENKND